jgi:hypothetical protein
VFGPLPLLHRALLLLTVLLVGIASGAWVGHFAIVPVAVGAGAAAGGVAGLLLGYLLVHDFHHRVRPARVAHRR